ncbi:cell wall-active antibiotics response protein LiaF [Paenibacillus spongiae]|uniref:Cell wall-active antibiotics response protein LiaF n=1 Tax=Paenibacillus spongiae TaxID=2909671 RepID=A0ABY5SDF6_9BACL|nr:cell wall-active antibiotics response protein LiaF [Paenibacillus spongiae]UVI31789.1 cell wall-active antibiotics response protein LiaF [Paenibacillus spongiae]
MNGHFLNRLMWGLFIIAIGVGLMLKQGGVFDFDLGDIISVFWPLLLMFLGLKEFVKRAVGGQGSFWGAAVLTIVGFVFLGRNMGWFIWEFGDIIQFALPVIIILFGFRMIMKPKKKGGDTPSPTDEWKAYPYSPSDKPVPPAPPLHPDPTKPGSGLNENDYGAEQQGSKNSNPNPNPNSFGPHHEGGYTPHNNAGHYESKMQSKLDRMQERAERVRERMERKADNWSHRCGERHGRTEWWNSDSNAQNRSGFIGDIYVGQDYYELKPMNISHFIGDTVLDLTKAQIPFGETRIHISSFIGDVKVFIPNDYEVGVHVVSSAFIGDVSVLDRKEGGMFKNMNVETAYFHETEKKVKLVVSTFIGDVRVTKVG